MANPSTTVKSIPTRVDRYPAKMISHLADRLIDKYAEDATHVLDPFCGSGAVLRAAAAKGIAATGVDVNPFGVLLSRVKMEGFDIGRASKLMEEVSDSAKTVEHLPMNWNNKTYWYTPATLAKFEAIRGAASYRTLDSSKSGRAVLLSLGLAARLCSRADQRSPKPFISKTAKKKRGGKHFDPLLTMQRILDELSILYSGRRSIHGTVIECDLGINKELKGLFRPCSHVITSPPYVNAQDYFRNSKLELYLLEGLLPFQVSDIRSRFIGSERGLSRSVLKGSAAEDRRKKVQCLSYLERNKPELAVVVHTYLLKMKSAFTAVKNEMTDNGTLVVVCGDNLIGGRRIVTWKVLNRMIEELGFTLFDSFEDKIRNRALAPARSGHKGLIKQEVVSAFRRT